MSPDRNSSALERSTQHPPPSAPAAREAGRRAIWHCHPARRSLVERRCPHSRRRPAIVEDPPAPARVFAHACDGEDASRPRDPSTHPALLEDRTMETYRAMEEKDAAAWARQRRTESDWRPTNCSRLLSFANDSQ